MLANGVPAKGTAIGRGRRAEVNEEIPNTSAPVLKVGSANGETDASAS
jgi:hypothetical protein